MEMPVAKDLRIVDGPIVKTAMYGFAIPFAVCTTGRGQVTPTTCRSDTHGEPVD